MPRRSFCARYSNAMAEIYAADLIPRLHYGYRPNPVWTIVRALSRTILTYT